MAQIRYNGPVNPLRIPGVGPVGPEWTPCSEAIAQEFSKEPDFEVQVEKPAQVELSDGGDA